MATIHMGVIDTPHQGGKTTQQVANILEAKYGLIEKFVEMRKAEITDAIVESYANAIMGTIEGHEYPSDFNPAGDATSLIEHMFKDALSHKAFDGVISGVPTEAALRGHSKRFKRVRMSRPSRPSFIDTGVYQSSFHVWVE